MLLGICSYFCPRSDNFNKLSISEGLTVLTASIDSNCSLNDSCQSKCTVIKWIILIPLHNHLCSLNKLKMFRCCLFDKNLTKQPISIFQVSAYFNSRNLIFNCYLRILAVWTFFLSFSGEAASI